MDHGLKDEFPLLWEMAREYDFADRLGGCTSPLHAEVDAALRELWMGRSTLRATNQGGQMSVAINSTRKTVEISWDPSGGVTEPAPPDGFPTHPIHRPDLHPDQGLPPVEEPVDPGYGVDEGAHPAHPIVLPPYIWGPTDPRPTPPIQLPDDIGLDEEQKEKLKQFLTGNLPPFNPPEYVAPVNVAPVNEDGNVAAVQVFAQGQEGDWSNTAVMPNDGLAALVYPQDFSGTSYVEVRALDGTVVDSGTISVS